MEMPYTDYFDATALRREYLIGSAFLANYKSISRDFIWQEQNERFKRLLGRAWRMQFYRTLWGNHGVKPGAIRSLLDIEKLPVFDANYLAAAGEDPASFGDFTGQDSYPLGTAPPVVNNFFGPRGAAIGHRLFARAGLFQGEAADGMAQFLERTHSQQLEITAAWQSPTNLGRYSIKAAGLIAMEGPDRDGLYLMEDAHFVEILSALTQSAVADGTQGALVVTSLYKDDIAPLIRFNTHDVGAICLGESSLGLNLRRVTRAWAH